MILLKLKGEQVVGIVLDITPDHVPKDNEVVINDFPQLELKEKEKAYLFWRNGQVEYEIKKGD